MKKLFIFLILCGISITLPAQVEEEIEEDPSFWDRVYFGGNFGLQFGNITLIEVAPLMGYRITNDFSAGLGVTYQYFKADYGAFDFQTNIYGGRLFVRHNILQQFFAYGEYESLNLEFVDRFGEINREWVPALFVGGGLFQPIGRRAGINIMALYNLMHDNLRSPYNEPWVIRAGITAGF